MAVIQNTPSAYIIILNYNSWEDSIECVEAILNSSFKDFQIILIDNCSTDSSDFEIKTYLKGAIRPKIANPYFENKLVDRKVDKLNYVYVNLTENDLKSKDPLKLDNLIEERPTQKDSPIHYPILFAQTNKNLGFARGNNVALKSILNTSQISNDTKVMLLNPDTFITSDALGELMRIDKTSFIQGCQIKYYRSPNSKGYLGACKLSKPFGNIAYLEHNRPEQIDYIYGGALLTNKNTLVANGVLPANYFLYWEETDWCYSAKLKGVDLSINDKAVVYNKIGTSVGRGYLANYYFIRNGLWFYKKFLPKYIPTLLLSYVVRGLKKIIKLEFRNLKAIIKGVAAYFKGEQGNAHIN